MKFVGPASALALTAALGGCATITRGTTTQFTVESTPPGAQVTTSTGISCVATPCTFLMPRKNAFVVTVSKVGYTSAATQIRTVLAEEGAETFIGNALVGGVIGAGLDVYNGAAMDLAPNPLNVVLQPAAPVPPPPITQATPPGPAPAQPSSPAPNQGTTAAPTK